MNALNKAISIVGSQKALAEEVGVVQSAVANWLKRGSVPVEHCLAIEKATAGRVTRQELRPDDAYRIWTDLVIRPSSLSNVFDKETNRLMDKAFQEGLVTDRRNPTMPGRRKDDLAVRAENKAFKSAKEA